MIFPNRKHVFILLTLLGVFFTNVTFCLALQEGFVYVKDVDPTIHVSLRYFSEENFIGHPVEGYKAPKAILTAPAAQQLAKAQAHFQKEGYSIVIYDAYRPQTAVNHFMRWSEDKNDQTKKEEYYPHVDKAKVFDLGYVAKKSGHSRGSTVDMSIIRLDVSLQPPVLTYRELANGVKVPFLDDGTMDMGASFDLFDEVSHTDTTLIGQEHQESRQYVKGIMGQYGFKNYVKEWWHFTLEDEPYPDTYFDFPVQ